jgi:hypothetical protein
MPTSSPARPSASSAIARLPAELLAEVFVLAVHGSADDHTVHVPSDAWPASARAPFALADDGASVPGPVKTALEHTGDRLLDVLVDARCPDWNFPYAILSLLHAEVSDA